MVMDRRSTCVEAVEDAIRAMDTFDRHVHATISRRDEPALREAAGADRLAMEGHRPLPLSGTTVGFKDNVDVAGMRTTAGSPLHGKTPALSSAPVVTRLRRAGSIVVAKHNMSELAIGADTQNRLFGPCRNPLALDVIPGGSSGGSAVAVSLGMCTVGLATDTAGSIRIPAAAVGVVGLRPSPGLIPTAGVVPVSYSFDTVGPLARTVDDLARFFFVLTDGRVRKPVGGLGSARSAQSGGDLAGVRIGVAEGRFFESNVDAGILDTVARSLELLAGRGAELVPVRIPLAVSASTAVRTLVLHQAASYYREQMEASPEEFHPRILARLHWGSQRSGADVARAMRWCELFVDCLTALFRRVDFVVSPTLPIEAPAVDQLSDEGLVDLTRFTYPWSAWNGPTISLPCGASGERALPVGLQVTAPRFSEAALFRLARVIEMHQHLDPGPSRLASHWPKGEVPWDGRRWL